MKRKKEDQSDNTGGWKTVKGENPEDLVKGNLDLIEIEFPIKFETTRNGKPLEIIIDLETQNFFFGDDKVCQY